MTDRYAVIGYPVAHSLSPRIHTMFAAQTGEDLVYERLSAPPGHFGDAVAEFFAGGGRGLNVTVPYKAEAFALADVVTGRAERAQAANTLRLEADARIGADNTDGAGLVADLARNAFRVRGRRVLLLGAGGAARGCLGPLLDAGPAALVVANRTPARAQALVAAMGAPAALAARALDALERRAFDLVVNATSAGLGNTVPELPEGVLAERACCYDLAYGAAARPFLDWARRCGAARWSDGLGMLVEQAAESFLVWRGVRPQTAPVLAALRAPNAPEAAPGPR